LEQAKRLELSEPQTEAASNKKVRTGGNTSDAQNDAHGAGVPAEIVAAWPTLRPELRAAILAIVASATGGQAK
jgi:hypothetical protein